MILHSNIFPNKSENSKIEYLLILHGFLGMSDNWKSLAVQFSENGFDVHVLDLRNHGKSFQTDDFSYDLMVDDVLRYCEYHQIQKTNIIGHSMGGKLAMFLAIQNQNLVEKLVIADIAPKYYEPHHDKILIGLQAVDFAKKPSRAKVDEILQNYIPDFGTRQFLLKNLYWQTPGQLAFRFNLTSFLNNKLAVGEVLPESTKFEKPTLFLRGGNSNYILDSDAQNIIKHFPNSETIAIPNVGHWLHAENPVLFFQKTLFFLQ